jgi:DNA-binding NarL/FixJ family response regulator
LQSPVKVIVADGHGLFRKTLCRLVTDTDGLVLSGSAGCQAEVMSLLPQVDAGVVLMEMRLPKVHEGIEFCRQLRQSHPHIGIVVITACTQKPLLQQMLAAGPHSMLLKNTTEDEEILLAIRLVAAGGTHFSKEFTGMLPGGKKLCNLTEEQQELLRMICCGEKSIYIANKACRSRHAINKRRVKLMKDCGVTNLIELIQFALQTGLIDWSHLFE